MCYESATEESCSKLCSLLCGSHLSGFEKVNLWLLFSRSVQHYLCCCTEQQLPCLLPLPEKHALRRHGRCCIWFKLNSGGKFFSYWLLLSSSVSTLWSFTKAVCVVLYVMLLAFWKKSCKNALGGLFNLLFLLQVLTNPHGSHGMTGNGRKRALNFHR